MNNDLKKIDQDQIRTSKSFLDRLNEINQQSYYNKLNSAVKKSEARGKHLQDIIGNKTTEEPQAPDQIENLNKLHHYRELKRNRDTKETSMYNRLTALEKSTPRSRPNLSPPNERTGLLW